MGNIKKYQLEIYEDEYNLLEKCLDYLEERIKS